MHEPREDPVFLLQPDQNPPGWETADKRFGAVDRIDDPINIRGPRRCAVLFADHPEIRTVAS